MTFLERLAAEWYEYEGYFVRSNVRARKRAKGGFDVELDVLAYDLPNNTLLHVETSGDADSWAERERRFRTKKFILKTKEYEAIIGCRVSKIRKIAVVGYARATKTNLNWGGDIELVPIPDFVKQIAEKLGSQHPAHEAVPEGFPLLRAMQTVLAYGT